jgi:hypothetical protein
MKNLVLVLSLFFSFNSFGQKEGYPTVMPKPKPIERSNVETVTVNKEKFYINGVDFSDSHDGEKSLALAMNKMSDEELLAFIKKYLLVDNSKPEKKD